MKRIDSDILDEVVRRAKAGSDFDMKNEHATLILKLARIPRKNLELPQYEIIKSRILHRIAEMRPVKKLGIKKAWNYFSQAFKIGGAIAAVGLILTSLAVGTAVAALQSAPGDSIYPLKKVAENIQLKLIQDESGKADLQLKFATTRLEELQEILAKQQTGEISEDEALKAADKTVQELKTTATAAASSAANVTTPKSTTVNKLADLNQKLRTAAIQSEGTIKVELEKTLETTEISKELAIKNLERAGIKLEENNPIILDEVNQVTAHGNLVAVTETSVSIGTAKFFLTKDTKFNNTTLKNLKVGMLIDITGEIKDNKTYALEISVAKETEPQKSDTNAPYAP